MKKLFKVSTKAAIFNHDNTKVLVIHMGYDDDWGLPGGHVDEGETPDEAVARELFEECGVSSSNLKHADFFLHSQGKLILAYVGTADDEVLKSQQSDLEGKPKWLTKDEFTATRIEPGYRRLVLDNWADTPR